MNYITHTQNYVIRLTVSNPTFTLNKLPVSLNKTASVTTIITTQKSYPKSHLNKHYEKTIFRLGNSSYDAGCRLQSKK